MDSARRYQWTGAVMEDRRPAAPCSWCWGTGWYLEAMDCEGPYVYMAILCGGCAGSGRRE